MATWREERPVDAPERPSQAVRYGNTSSPDPKPAKRQKASQGDWEAIRALFTETSCLVCPSHLIELHHVVPRSQGGDDLAVNLAPLCHDHHMILEDHSPGWEQVAVAVRKYVLSSRERCVYMKSKMTWDRFNKRYPLLSEGEAPRPGVQVGTTLAASSSESDWDKYERPDERVSPWEVEPRNEIEGVEF